MNDLTPHSEAAVSFDLFIIRSWDGNAEGIEGPDIWQLSVMGEDVLLRTTFDNHNIPEYEDHRQSFPENYIGEYPPRTGAAEKNTLGYKWCFTGVGSLPADSVYHINFEFDHDSERLILEFSAENLLDRFNNESWGIDNVRVEVGN